MAAFDQGPQLLLFAMALLLSGVGAGLVAGLLGVGGGIIVVPVFFQILTFMGVDEAVRMHVTVATSLAVIIPTSLSSVTSHNRRGAVDWTLLKSWAPAMTAGVVIGSLLASVADHRALTAVFAAVAFLFAINLAFGREDWRLGSNMPGPPLRETMAAVIGCLSTMMGIGGGTFGVTVMTLFGYPIHRAVGTAAGLGALISIPGTLGFVISGWSVPDRPPYSLGYVSLIGFALIAPGTVLAAPWGARLAHAFSRKTLTRVFALFLALTAVRMASQL
jgi:uncharacterized membrane protein YfcA